MRFIKVPEDQRFVTPEEASADIGYVYVLRLKGADVYRIESALRVSHSIERLRDKKKFGFDLAGVSNKVGGSWRFAQDLREKFRDYHLGDNWFALPDKEAALLVRLTEAL